MRIEETTTNTIKDELDQLLRKFASDEFINLILAKLENNITDEIIDQPIRENFNHWYYNRNYKYLKFRNAGDPNITNKNTRKYTKDFFKSLCDAIEKAKKKGYDFPSLKIRGSENGAKFVFKLSDEYKIEYLLNSFNTTYIKFQGWDFQDKNEKIDRT